MKEKIHKIVTEYPSDVEELLFTYWENMPQQAEEDINEILYGCHIATEEAYSKYVNHLPMVKWSLMDIMNAVNNKIDFSQKKYTNYDFAFLMNYLYMNFKEKIADASYFIFMTQALLESPYAESPEGLAYEIAKDLKEKVR